MTRDFLLILAAALALDALIGYPGALFRMIGHPVTWMGALIAFADRRFNRDVDPFGRRLLAGLATLAAISACCVLLAAGLTVIVEHIAPHAVAIGLIALLTSSLLAQRSLDDHVRAVADALEREGVRAGRVAVGMIVGRDTQSLDEAGICRAAIESLAESASDGVVAPAFWIALGGLPGGVFYKVVNTADSMIGHRTPRHRAFGWAAARLDDLINLPASRLSAVLIIAAAVFLPTASPIGATRCAWRDAGKHKSPNAGWPEAAMAGALGLKLAGPRLYDGELVDSVYIGDGREDATIADIRRALLLWRIAAALQFMLVSALAIFIAR